MGFVNRENTLATHISTGRIRSLIIVLFVLFPALIPIIQANNHREESGLRLSKIYCTENCIFLKG